MKAKGEKNVSALGAEISLSTKGKPIEHSVKQYLKEIINYEG